MRDLTINKILHYKSKNRINKKFGYPADNIREKGKFCKLNKTSKNLISKNESFKSIICDTYKNYQIIDSSKNKNKKNNNNLIINNSVYNTCKKKKTFRTNFISPKLEQLQILSELNISFPQKQKEKLNINNNKLLNTDNNSSKKNKISLKINKNIIKNPKKINFINFRIKILNSLNKREKKNKLYKLFRFEKIIKIIFSYCETDIDILNKICLISKEIYMKIKPFIYKKISSIIKECNSSVYMKNKIKEYLMKNNSSLVKLPHSVLYIKYNDLLFENNKYDIEIKKDLTRTFPNNVLFNYGNIYYNKLYHILVAYSNLNKTIGYVQGINYIAAHIIYIFENEIDELIFLDALINKFKLDKILENNLNKEFYEKITRNINLFIINQIPKLDKFLKDINLNIEFFTSSWILTLFSDSTNTDFLIIILDYMIIFGWKFVKYFIANILLMFENDILNSNQRNITHLKKSILRNEKFKNNFDKIIKDTERMMINDINII